MKMITGILGCALAAGLMTFAADKAEAGVNIGNELYSPLKIKVTAQYQDSNGKLKTMSVTGKDVLSELGYNNNVQLAEAAYGSYDIWIINKDTLIRNLSTNDVLTLGTDYYTYSYSGKENEKYTESGLASVDFNSDMSYDYFTISGPYTYSSKYGKTNKNGEYNFSENLNAKSLSGYGYFADLSESSVVVTGSTSYSGSDKFQALE